TARSEGAVRRSGQLVGAAAPVAERRRRVRDAALPARPVPGGQAGDGAPDLREMPGGVSNTTHGEGVGRGVGYGIGIKNVGSSEGFDDYSTARVRLAVVAGEPTVTGPPAAREGGPGPGPTHAQSPRAG